jgi:hypothetical protein
MCNVCRNEPDGVCSCPVDRDGVPPFFFASGWFQVDHDLESGEAEFRDHDGNVLLRVTNIGTQQSAKTAATYLSPRFDDCDGVHVECEDSRYPLPAAYTGDEDFWGTLAPGVEVT